jgi:4-amino-4-deoxy-L-arabinose transferase-like glycosyltransferase
VSFSWQSSSAASPANPAAGASPLGAGVGVRPRLRALTARLPRPELSALIVLAALLDLWALARNGWANDYYSAAVRSMSSSWHNFLFASADPSGVMSVDKPPLDLWVQSLSVRVFGYHPLSMLVPQALMGVASVALIYDLVRRRFGRLGGFVAGLALALTPITVAISRHNNPDVLLILCCVAALWFTVRALEDGRTRWLVLAGVSVGLGFETKMLVALTVVPGIVLAYLYVAPRGRLRALRQLLAGGLAMLIVGGAWPALVALTPAASRPWISGTSDNSILSLIFEYNGLGRVDGQAGGPGGLGGGGSVFGGSAGPLRLLNSALGGQAGWLLGFALVSGVGILVASRLRRADARSGWLIAVGGAFLTTAVLFSSASGILHPYYVSLLAPFIAALIGAGAVQLVGGGLQARVIAPLAIAAGVATELAVLHDYPGQLSWLAPVLIALCVLAALTLALLRVKRLRLIALAVALAALLLAPAVWAVDTLGHATSGTFPEGGPGNVQTAGGMFGGAGGRGGPGGRAGRFGGFGPGASGASGAGAPPAGGGIGVPGGEGAQAGAGRAGVPGTEAGSERTGGVVPLFGGAGGGTSSAGSEAGARSRVGAAPGGFGGGGIGGPMGNDQTITEAIAYAKQHGGGTVAVSSQSSAASAIIASGAKVAGIGGFSGRESDVSVSWLAQEVRSGAIRWVLVEQSGFGAGAGAGAGHGSRALPGDTRAGSKAAMSAAAKVCKRVALGTSTSTNTAGTASLFSSEGTAGAAASESTSGTGLYDCRGDATALASA